MRPLLIGQAPGPRTDPELPLFPVPKTSAGGRLQCLMGLTRGEYMRTFERVNLLYCFPGKHKRDDKFPMSPARTAAMAMRPLLAERTVIFIGRNVANAFGFEADWHDWIDWPVRRRSLTSDHWMCRAAVVPHPSGRNHWYNNAENKQAASAFWFEFLNRQPVDGKVLPFLSA